MNWRSTASLVSFVLASAAFAQSGQNVAAVWGADRLSNIIPKLAEATNQALTVDPEIEGLVIFVHMKQVNRKKLMDMVAESVNGRWVPQGNGLQLTRDLRREAQIRANEDTTYRKNVMEGLASQRKMLAEAIPKMEDAENPAEAAEMRSYWETHRMTVEAVLAIPQNVLLNLAPGQRLVLASNPTAMQGRLPSGNFIGLAQRMIKTRNAQAEAMREAMEELSPEERKAYDQMKEMMGPDFDDLFGSKPITSEPAKVVMIISRPKGALYAEVQFGVLDRAGRYLLRQEVSLMADDEEDAAYAAGMAAAAAAEAAAGTTAPSGEAVPDAPVPMSDDEKPEPPPEMVKVDERTQMLMSHFSWGPNKPKLSAEDLAMVQRPDLHEPLSYTLGPILTSYFEKAGIEGVGYVTDDWFYLARSAGATVSQVRGMLGDKAPTPGKPTVFAHCEPDPRSYAVNRKDMMELLDKAEREGHLSLDDLATYASKNPPLDTSSVGQFYAGAILGESRGMLGGAANAWETLRFWGSLNPGQRQTLRAGGSFNVGSLSPASREMLSQWVFGAGRGLRKLNTAPVNFLDSNALFFGQSRDVVGALEPTEVLPNGLPANGIIASLNLEEKALTATVQGQRGTISLTELALFDLLKDLPSMAEYSGMMELGEMSLGSRRSMEITFTLAPENHGVSVSLVDMGKPTGQKMTMATMPADIKAEYEAARERVKTSRMYKFIMNMANMGGGFGFPGTARPGSAP